MGSGKSLMLKLEWEKYLFQMKNLETVHATHIELWASQPMSSFANLQEKGKMYTSGGKLIMTHSWFEGEWGINEKGVF